MLSCFKNIFYLFFDIFIHLYSVSWSYSPPTSRLTSEVHSPPHAFPPRSLIFILLPFFFVFFFFFDSPLVPVSAICCIISWSCQLGPVQVTSFREFVSVTTMSRLEDSVSQTSFSTSLLHSFQTLFLHVSPSCGCLTGAPFWAENFTDIYLWHFLGGRRVCVLTAVQSRMSFSGQSWE